MKDNTLKSDRSRKQVKRLPTFEKYQLKNKSNALAVIMASLLVLVMLSWVLTGFGLVVSYYLFKYDHPVWASTIIIIDLLLVRNFIKTKH